MCQYCRKLLRKEFYETGQRWYRGRSQICFATFFWQENTKLPIIHQPLKLEGKISTDLDTLDLKNTNVCLTKFRNNKILPSKIGL